MTGWTRLLTRLPCPTTPMRHRLTYRASTRLLLRPMLLLQQLAAIQTRQPQRIHRGIRRLPDRTPLPVPWKFQGETAAGQLSHGQSGTAPPFLHVGPFAHVIDKVRSPRQPLGVLLAPRRKLRTMAMATLTWIPRRIRPIIRRSDPRLLPLHAVPLPLSRI
jgi:hypothetical protein